MLFHQASCRSATLDDSVVEPALIVSEAPPTVPPHQPFSPPRARVGRTSKLTDARVDDLEKIGDIGPKMLEALRPRVIVGQGPATQSK